MTAPIEALERISDLIADLAGEHEVTTGPLDPTKWKIEVSVSDLQAMIGCFTSLEGDAVERVAETAQTFWQGSSGRSWTDCCEKLPAQANWFRRLARAILATGLVAGEAAIGQAALWVINYTNYRGETSVRRIIPKSVRFGSTEWHPEPQWLLLAWDDDKQADREFALKDFGSPESAIRADEREKCARIAESECYATTGRQIAAAIRSGGTNER